MSERPANFFRSLAGVPVLYDRTSRSDYGIRGVPRDFHVPQSFEDALDACFAELWRACPLDRAETILSAGTYVDRRIAQHNRGLAMDIDAILWPQRPFVTLNYPTDKQFYIAVEAILRRHFDFVLTYLQTTIITITSMSTKPASRLRHVEITDVLYPVPLPSCAWFVGRRQWPFGVRRARRRSRAHNGFWKSRATAPAAELAGFSRRQPSARLLTPSQLPSPRAPSALRWISPTRSRKAWWITRCANTRCRASSSFPSRSRLAVPSIPEAWRRWPRR